MIAKTAAQGLKGLVNSDDHNASRNLETGFTKIRSSV